MDARHASLGRRILEEIRQKRAAEKCQKLLLVAISQKLLQFQTMLPGCGNRIAEIDVSILVSQLKDFQRRNSQLEQENKSLESALRAKEKDNDAFLKRETIK